MGKHLKNAPLYFTIAQVQFNPILELEEFLPKQQERLRKLGYPDFRKQQHLTFTVPDAADEDGDATQSRVSNYSFTDIDNREGFLLNSNSLSFQTTRYDTFEDFADKFFRGLELLHESLELSYCDRQGLRYLDAVMPREGDKLKDYLVPHVMGLSDHFSELSYSYSESRATEGDCNIISRAVVQNGSIGLPPDLARMQLEIEDRFQAFEGRHAILDTDAFTEQRQPVDFEQLRLGLKELHQLNSKTFKEVTTEHATTFWKGE